MTQLSELYNSRILELSAAIPPAGRLSHPDASATAHSKLCGSTIDIDLAVRERRVTDYRQTVKACLLGQAAASVMAREIVGSTFEELHAVAASMRDMLKANGKPPSGRWADLGVLEPVRNVKARHASTLLVFEAVEKALASLEHTAHAAP